MHARYNTMTNSGRRTSKGRQKIEIKRIEKEAARLVSFSRRRAGLFKKANELSVLCGVEVAVVAFSPAGKPFSFGHPSVDAVVHRFASGAGGASVPPRRAPQESSAPMAVAREFGRELARLGEVLQGQKRRKQELEKAIAAVLGGASPSDGWLRVGLQRLQVDVLTRLQQLVMEDQTSSSNMAMDATAAAGGGIGGLCAGYGHAMMDNRILAHPASYDFGQVLGFGQGFGYGQGFF